MKINRHGRAKILTTHELQLVFVQKYLEVSDSQLLGAAATLAMLSPVGDALGQRNEPSPNNPTINRGASKSTQEGLAHFSSHSPGENVGKLRYVP